MATGDQASTPGGPYLVGTAAVQETNFARGLLRIAPWPLLAAVIILILAYTRPKQSRDVITKTSEPQEGLKASASPGSAADHPGSEA